MKAYILTSEYNHYNQMGEYFIAWFHKKPTLDELRQVMIREEEVDSCGLCRHILDGGGRSKLMEELWYHLREISSATTAVESGSAESACSAKPKITVSFDEEARD